MFVLLGFVSVWAAVAVAQVDVGAIISNVLSVVGSVASPVAPTPAIQSPILPPTVVAPTIAPTIPKVEVLPTVSRVTPIVQ